VLCNLAAAKCWQVSETNNNAPTQFSFSPCAILIHPHKTSAQTTGCLVPVLKLGQRVEVTSKIMHFCPEINIQPWHFPELVALHNISPHRANHLKSCHHCRDNYFNGQMTQNAHSSEVLMHLDTKMQNVAKKERVWKERSHDLNTLLLKMKSQLQAAWKWCTPFPEMAWIEVNAP